jgi:hypothetical protein
MKIQIINCSNEYYWYREEVGKIFEVFSHQILFKDRKYQIIKAGDVDYFIDYNDAKVLFENPEIENENTEVLVDSKFMYWLMTNKYSTWITLIEDIKLYKLINN